jgi:hypothetical protein
MAHGTIKTAETALVLCRKTAGDDDLMRDESLGGRPTAPPLPPRALCVASFYTTNGLNDVHTYTTSQRK